MKLNSKLTKVLGLFVVMGAALGAWSQWSPFAWTWEFREVADVSYGSAISQLERLLILKDEQIYRAEKDGADRNRIIQLKIERSGVRRQIEELKQRKKVLGR